MLAQQFGTIDTPQGPATAMLCIDADLPNEVTLQWWHEATKVGYAIVSDAVWTGDALHLKPRNLHRVASSGAIQSAVAFSDDERNFMRSTYADLVMTADGLTGTWHGLGDTSGAITLTNPVSPYIAAFFAFSDALDLRGTSGTSDCVRIYGLSKEFVGVLAAPVVILPWVKPYVNTLSIGPLHNPRLAAQQGHFLVTNIGDVESHIRTMEANTNTTVLSAVDIPVSEITEGLKDLAFMGLTAATLFPGLTEWVG